MTTQETGTSQHTKPLRRVRPKSTAREWTEFLITLVIMVFFIRVTTVEAYRIPTGSMENTLLVGDFLLVNKFIYGIRTPDWVGIPFTGIGVDLPWWRLPAPRHVEPGDIVVFKYPKDRSVNYIKRCVAGPGQIIEIKNRQVYVDGVLSEFPPESKFTSPAPVREGLGERGIFSPQGELWNHDNFGPLEVPEGHYFMMGDNRDNSADSRYWGFLPEEDVIGKALIIYFSWDKNRTLSDVTKSVRFSRIGNWIK
ncbi:MAG: signal peptidase I [Calditrichaeota bacterium]|nr:signal peptidase I [Calditrichota bacterium]MCB9366562.1 signal peptidase I [Calditrichota bacterium]MCB9391180.1 signal peptidase I [Calditrichota bacterium]